jgi:SpoVK/Ycf46/Vps4 family AAA+-type ATPase
LAEKANGLSGAEITLICREAGLVALSEDAEELEENKNENVEPRKMIEMKKAS